MKTIELLKIQEEPGQQGPHRPYYTAWYVVKHESGELDTHLMQRFSFGPTHNLGPHELVWRAEGTLEALTLTPSYLCTWKDFSKETGMAQVTQENRVHFFLVAGKIQLCGDSTVKLP